jgi:hypothetical protein
MRTVCAAASDQVAATKTSSVKRNILAGRSRKVNSPDVDVLLFFISDPSAVGVYNLMVVDADRQRAVAGAISTYGIQDLASTASCDHPVARNTSE